MSLKITKINLKMEYSIRPTTICSKCNNNILEPTKRDLNNGILYSKIIGGECGHFYHASCAWKMIDCGDHKWKQDKAIDFSKI